MGTWRKKEARECEIIITIFRIGGCMVELKLLLLVVFSTLYCLQIFYLYILVKVHK